MRRCRANDGSDHFREAFKSRILPAWTETRPDLIIISAGFDAHHRDPLAEINLVEPTISTGRRAS
jgi:acetoin utilization deacetylase AcuC-like enzyme